MRTTNTLRSPKSQLRGAPATLRASRLGLLHFHSGRCAHFLSCPHFFPQLDETPRFKYPGRPVKADILSQRCGRFTRTFHPCFHRLSPLKQSPHPEETTPTSAHFNTRCTCCELLKWICTIRPFQTPSPWLTLSSLILVSVPVVVWGFFLFFFTPNIPLETQTSFQHTTC